jgi:hypothetical protein
MPTAERLNWTAVHGTGLTGIQRDTTFSSPNGLLLYNVLIMNAVTYNHIQGHEGLKDGNNH